MRHDDKQHSYLSDRYGSPAGNLFGVILIIAAVVLLSWNELKTIALESDMGKSNDQVIQSSSTEVDPANEGKLIYLNGYATASNAVTDAEFGITMKVIKLKRKVEIYQWIQSKDEDNSYEYNKDWRDKLISSARYWTENGHRNPTSVKYETKPFFPEKVEVGKFELGDELIVSLKETRALLNADSFGSRKLTLFAELPAGTAGDLVLKDNYFYLSKEPYSPKVGDLRISFWTVLEGDVTAIGKQSGNKIIPFRSANATEIALIASGTVPKTDLFKTAEPRDRYLHWLFRVVALILLISGLQVLKNAISTVAEALPQFSLATSAELFGMSIVLATAGLCWLTANLMIGLSLLGASLVLIVTTYLITKKRQYER